MIGLDTGFLVGLAVREHPAHPACWALFEAEIRSRGGSMALTAQVLAEFAHVVTDPRRFEQPLAMPEALDLCALWWNAQECRQVIADFDAGTLFLSWMEAHRLGRKRLLDTLLAASYHRAGVRRIATTDWRDFTLYGVFEVLTLGI
ncbi:MAG: type II toxin-antitoxin system VapC family toxin [Nitrococcus sp.]|nr:type II toxin-antitoxin system VapC family toxin [Nitrococcus sp.]